MPTLKHLIDELKKLDVSPDEVRLPGTLYDDLVEQAEDNIEENPEEQFSYPFWFEPCQRAWTGWKDNRSGMCYRLIVGVTLP